MEGVKGPRQHSTQGVVIESQIESNQTNESRRCQTRKQNDDSHLPNESSH